MGGDPASGGLRGRRVLISAGPMRTALDPVRFVQNRSSGKTGLALARACAARGARVAVLLGPVADAVRAGLAGLEVTGYEGPADYRAALERLFPACDAFLSAAAVLDFECVPSGAKLERSALGASPRLEIPIRPVPDLVAACASRRRPGQAVVAFAAETGTAAEIVARARAKMGKKGVDAVVANPVWPGLGPDGDCNRVWILRPGRPDLALEPAPKDALGARIVDALFDA